MKKYTVYVDQRTNVPVNVIANDERSARVLAESILESTYMAHEDANKYVVADEHGVVDRRIVDWPAFGEYPDMKAVDAHDDGDATVQEVNAFAQAITDTLEDREENLYDIAHEAGLPIPDLEAEDRQAK